MRLRRTLPAVLALGLLCTATARATSSKITYSASGSYVAGDCSHEIDCTQTYGYSGSSACAKNCLPGAPSGGSFAISLAGSPLHPPGPCTSKKVSGSVEVVWSDSTTTIASITGSYSKKKAGYSLKLTVTGGTNKFIPPGPPAKGFLSHPPSPCSTASFTGSLIFNH